MKSKHDTEVRIIYHRAGFESKVGHQVRSTIESVVCDWLMDHGIAHRHGSEVFTVRIGASATPTVYVPDVILHDKDKAGRTVIIELYDAYTPKIGSTRIIAAFRKEMAKNYYIIMIAKKQQMHKVLKEAYDALVDVDNLDALQKKLPLRPRSVLPD